MTCDHQCTSNCRRNGCNCLCGEYHCSPDEKCRYEGEECPNHLKPTMYDYHCGKCGGLVPEPMKMYGYSGQYCHCETPTQPKETMWEQKLQQCVEVKDAMERMIKTPNPTMYERITTKIYAVNRRYCMGVDFDPHKLATVLEEMENKVNFLTGGYNMDLPTPPHPDKDEQSWEAIESNIQNQTIDECISIVKKQDRNLVCDNGKELIIQALEALKK